MARITRVAKAQASKRPRYCDYPGCDITDRQILPGQAYMWFKANRYSMRHDRHAEHPTWRPSEMDTTKMAGAYAGQEAANDALDALTYTDYFDDGVPEDEQEFDESSLASDVTDALEAASSAAQDTADEYQEGIDALPDNLRDTSPSAEMAQERIDALESWRDELDSFSTSMSFEREGFDTFEEAAEAFFEDVISEARDVVDGLEF